MLHAQLGRPKRLLHAFGSRYTIGFLYDPLDLARRFNQEVQEINMADSDRNDVRAAHRKVAMGMLNDLAQRTRRHLVDEHASRAANSHFLTRRSNHSTCGVVEVAAVVAAPR